MSPIRANSRDNVALGGPASGTVNRYVSATAASYPGPVASVYELITNPGRRRGEPKPLVVDLTSAFVVGLGLWIIALVVTWLRWHAGDDTSTPVWTCVAGVAGGVVALVWARLTRPWQDD